MFSLFVFFFVPLNFIKKTKIYKKTMPRGSAFEWSGFRKDAARGNWMRVKAFLQKKSIGGRDCHYYVITGIECAARAGRLKTVQIIARDFGTSPWYADPWWPMFDKHKRTATWMLDAFYKNGYTYEGMMFTITRNRWFDVAKKLILKVKQSGEPIKPHYADLLCCAAYEDAGVEPHPDARVGGGPHDFIEWMREVGGHDFDPCGVGTFRAACEGDTPRAAEYARQAHLARGASAEAMDAMYRLTFFRCWQYGLHFSGCQWLSTYYTPPADWINAQIGHETAASLKSSRLRDKVTWLASLRPIDEIVDCYAKRQLLRVRRLARRWRTLAARARRQRYCLRHYVSPATAFGCLACELKRASLKK